MNTPRTRHRHSPIAKPDRREQIQLTSLEVFAKKGFPNSSLQDIADELGITRESIYYYFKSKKEILLSMILEPSRAMLAAAIAIDEADISPVEKLKALLRSHLEHFSPAYLEVSVALREKSLLDDEEFKELKLQWKRYEKIWVSTIALGQATGDFNVQLNTKVVAYGILGMCNWLSRWYNPSGSVTVNELADNFYALCTQGIVKQQRKPRRQKSA